MTSYTEATGTTSWCQTRERMSSMVAMAAIILPPIAIEATSGRTSSIAVQARTYTLLTRTTMWTAVASGSFHRKNYLGTWVTNDLPGCPKGGLLLGTDKRDRLRGQQGDDEVRGLGGFDTLEGGPGNDILYGGPGEDEVSGDEGADVIYGGDGDDSLYPGEGN